MTHRHYWIYPTYEKLQGNWKECARCGAAEEYERTEDDYKRAPAVGRKRK